MRTCGECIVCCAYFEINDSKLNKKVLRNCPHVLLPSEASTEVLSTEGKVLRNVAYYTGRSCNGNCAVHGTDQMPSTCSGYQCLWLQGYGDEDDRPDKSRMLFDRVNEVENAFEARPLQPEMEGSQEEQQLTEKFSRALGMPAILVGFWVRRPKRIIGRSIE